MDYRQLLELAESNQNSLQSFNLKKRNVFNGSKGKGPNPASVAAFKARQAKEEQDRLLKAKQEKDRLMALRAQSSKSLRKSTMMKNRTKDNDFSKIVMTNEQIEEKKRIEEKLNRKGIMDTKERMKAKIEIEKNISGLSKKGKQRALSNLNKSEPFKIISKPKISDIINKNKSSDSGKRPKRTQAPILSYDQLLNIASENSKSKTTLSDIIEEELQHKKQTRPMTQKEKDALKEEQFYKSRADKVKLPSFEELKKRKEQETKNINTDKTLEKPEQRQKAAKITKNTVEQYVPKPVRKSPSMNSSLSYKPNPVHRPESKLSTSVDNKLASSSNVPLRQERTLPVSLNKRKYDSPPPKPGRKLPPIGATYRRGIYDDYDVGEYMDEDDYDEDDDMADFIDDGPEEPEQEYSKAIREIFGYDKRKYRNHVDDDDDDDIEEASFSQVMKEEMHSLRAGIQEDLEDIRREEEEKRLKALRKKKMKQ